MNILFLCTFYHRAMIFYDTIQNLRPLGYRVQVFNAVAEGAEISEKYRGIMDENVVHSECFQKWDRYFYFRKQKKIHDALLQKIDLENCDLIHSHTFFNGGWVAYRLRKAYGIPYVVSVRDTDLNYFLRIPGFRAIAQAIAKNASGIQFLSESYKNLFLEKCFAPSGRKDIDQKSTVITNGVESFWLENKGEAKSLHCRDIRLICVGKIERRKNMEIVVKAAEMLEQKKYNVKLTIIGQVVDKEIYQHLQNSKITSVIPFMKKEELKNYYRDSDIFILPSITESFGRVYIEAMSQGLPVIYTRGQGFDGIFPDGDIGCAVNADNVEEIVTAVEQILSRYEEISKRCIAACDRFDWKKIALQLDTFYQKAGVRTK